jgi:ATP-dependent helicase HrpA
LHHMTTIHPIPQLRYPPELPIIERREGIIDAIREHQVLVITGETGSGKSTQIPKMCLEAGRGEKKVVGSTEPRRIAAVTLANRVAEELGEEGRRLVGYKIRFQDRTSRATRIKFMTDGILLAEAQKDRLFRSYDTLIIDEAHERTLNIDFLLGLIKKVLPVRPDLKVIVSSATIDPEKFSRAFGGAPIIEVTGRTYPVEVRYRPGLNGDEAEEETTYVDRAVAAVEELKAGRKSADEGDILVFMPTETDIRETVQRLEERRFFNTIVLPLFGRMPTADQSRVFQSTSQEKIVVATNVAETSITIPRIKYVVDTGLARLSLYNARSRTQGLPVLSISRSSADQRKGRCGRVKAGICVRLYSEDDYLARDPYTLPEIQRANLAEVILRMLYLRLGNIQDFPFLDPPSPAALKDGFAVLRELGAVDDHRRLTGLGRMMASLPLDPRLARMLVEGGKEGALREMIVLTSALSAQDPRERPLDQEAKADQAHAVFRDRRSDFVTLLKIWEAFLKQGAEVGGTEGNPIEWSVNLRTGIKPAPTTNEVPQGRGGVDPRPLSQRVGANSTVSRTGTARSTQARLPSRGKLRKFCREHFLSYRRMREWQDIHEEIGGLVAELGGFKMNEAPASYDSLHRSILSGYLSHVAMKKDKNVYMAAKNRQAMIFPGSGIFNSGGGWIVSAEMVQTSRLYARTAANIDPSWLEDLGRHLCQHSYSEPHWEKKRGQVVAFERVSLYGLTIVERRKVNYGPIYPAEAREIFIRSALVEGELVSRHGFLEHNRELIKQIEELENRSRRKDLLVDEEKLYEFYDRRLPDFADSRSLERFIKEQGGDGCLRMTEADLLKAEPDFAILDQFPDKLNAGDLDLPLRYAFNPGAEDDGVTVTVPVHALSWLPKERFDWPVPGLLPEKVLILLRALPKSVRRQFVPIGATAERLAGRLTVDYLEGDFYDRLTSCLFEMTGVRVHPELWDRSSLPSHLEARFEVVGPDGKVLGAGRQMEDLRSLAEKRHEDNLWMDARRRWEKERLTAWDCGEMPRQVEVGRDALGLMRHAYIGLAAEGDTAAFRLFTDPEEARRASIGGLLVLYSAAFSSELKQLKKDWAFPGTVASKIFFMGASDQADELLRGYLMCEIFDLHSPQWPDRRKFNDTVGKLKGAIAALGREMVDEVLQVIEEREETRAALDRYRKMGRGNPAVLDRMELLSEEMNALVPPDFLEHYRRSHIQQLPRYLRALRIRAERAYAAPEKDRLKAEQLTPYEERLQRLRMKGSGEFNDEAGAELDDLRWMLEEFKISLFSPEVKTRFRVSAKRLEEKWRELES